MKKITNNQLDISNLKIGLYILKINQENRISTKKLIIN
ncbi:MAG: T9SS type A sorting domain-containing protein [Polaribacter sp.]|nr:T9SS type A sorting domain-containing protein [Polaribacter sp.]